MKQTVPAAIIDRGNTLEELGRSLEIPFRMDVTGQ